MTPGCYIKSHESSWYVVEGTHVNCSICHPADEVARALIERTKAHPPPRYWHKPLYESAEDKRKRRRKDEVYEP